MQDIGPLDTPAQQKRILPNPHSPTITASQSSSRTTAYSRDDLDFADQLDAALKLQGFETLIERTISGGEEWEKRLLAFIRDCDTVVSAG